MFVLPRTRMGLREQSVWSGLLLRMEFRGNSGVVHGVGSIL